eukprot:jgi/Psemu1/65748/estExt_Genemark1.C_1500048
MDDADSFTEVVSNLKGLSKKSRDPRSIRVATVISALTDVVEGDVTPAKVYASTVTTLEATLQKDHAGDVDVIFDSLTTQAALLKILGVVIPHVASATLGATIGMTSRVLRGTVSSSLSILGTQDGATTNTLLDTNDGLGALSTVLCDACQAVGEVLRHLPPSGIGESVVKQLLMETLISLLQDTRQKVQNSAKDALNGLLLMGSPRCHPTILKTTTKYVNMHIDKYLKNPSQQTEIQDLIELTGFLGRSLVSLDFTTIGGRLMTILVDLLNEESSSSSPARPVFVANSHASTLKILIINSILSAIMSLLEADDEIGVKKMEKVDAFASRVLASLVQARPTLAFREGAAELDLLESGRTIYGEILISSTQRVLNNKATAEIGGKLLPMVLQHLLGLSRPVEADDSEGNDVAGTLFDVLAKGVHSRTNELEELIDGEEGNHARSEVQVMEQISMKLLPSLFKLVDSLHDASSQTSKKSGGDEDNMETDDSVVEKDATGVLVVTRSIASIAKKTIEKMCSLLALSQALVISECLDESSISLLYRSLKPIIRTDETPSRIQKRAYKVMAEICKRYHSFIAEPERLKEVMDLMSSTSATSQVSARFMRLKCLTFVVDGFENAAPAAQTLLCLKDYNAKTRDAAYKLLLSLQTIHGNSAEFIQMIAAAVGSTTSHMRSAAVTALSRLVFELSSDDIDVQNLIPALLKTVLMLTDDPSREVTKSMVVFVRVSVTAATAEQLQPLLPDILNGLLKYHRGKDRFREKIKIIIKKLVKYFGYETLMPFVPPSDSRLLTHMRKLSEREKRRKLTRRNQQREETRDFQAMEDSDEEDSDDGRTLMTGMTGLTKMSRMSRMSRVSSGKTLKRRHMETVSLAQSTRSGRTRTTMRIKSDADGNVTDVKDLKSVRFAEVQEDGSDAEDDMEFDSSGKLVVRDIDDDMEHNDDSGTVHSSRSKRSTTTERSTRSRNNDRDSTKKRNMARPGAAYKAKKAGGDNKKKGQKFEPYAYMQLDGRNYSKKNRRHAVEQMGSVVQRRNKRQKR